MSTPANSTARYDQLTLSQARMMRADQARLAALYADRVEQAAAAGSAGAAHWLHEYRRCTTRCRLLGERIRRGEPRSAAAAPERRPTHVGRFARSIPAPTPTREAA
jgi:hypothetical protein